MELDVRRPFINGNRTFTNSTKKKYYLTRSKHCWSSIHDELENKINNDIITDYVSLKDSITPLYVKYFGKESRLPSFDLINDLKKQRNFVRKVLRKLNLNVTLSTAESDELESKYGQLSNNDMIAKLTTMDQDLKFKVKDAFYSHKKNILEDLHNNVAIETCINRSQEDRKVKLQILKDDNSNLVSGQSMLDFITASLEKKYSGNTNYNYRELLK
jgi:hypothetical protein